jgi:hypothetical protein
MPQVLETLGNVFMRIPIIGQIVGIFNWSVQYAAVFIITRITHVQYYLEEVCDEKEGEGEGLMLKKHPLHDSKIAELSGVGEEYEGTFFLIYCSDNTNAIFSNNRILSRC